MFWILNFLHLLFLEAVSVLIKHHLLKDIISLNSNTGRTLNFFEWSSAVPSIEDVQNVLVT